VLATDQAGVPVAAKIDGNKVLVIAISGSELLTNPANDRILKNTAFVLPLFSTLTAARTSDSSLDVRSMASTYPTRIDPDRSLVVDSFRVFHPDSLPASRLVFLREYMPRIYRLVSTEVGYGVSENKTVIGLMCAGSGWTASSTLVGIGLLGDDLNVVSVLIHEMSNSLCVEAPVWLGDAGWSAYLQIRVKTNLGGAFAESVAGELDRRIADYQSWERQHGVYDLMSETNHHVGGGKVMHIVQRLEQRYGPDIMKRYFAAARRLKSQPVIASRSIQDRVVHYFSLATGEDQLPFFDAYGLRAQHIS